MEERVEEMAKRLLHRTAAELTETERQVLRHVIERKRITRHPSKTIDEQTTVGQRVADRIAAFGGSWPFIFIFGGVLLLWILTNCILLASLHHTFDPYPFILLNLVLSMLAAIQAPVIMMSQNRQAEKDRITTNHDYEVNLKAEVEIMSLHEKMDELRVQRWAELIEIQKSQIKMLQELIAALNPGGTPVGG